MARRSTGNPVLRALRGFARSLRLAVFGRQRPGRVLRDTAMTTTAELDPSESDPRAVGPADPPQVTGGPGAPRSLGGPGTGAHGGPRDHDELHIPRD